MNIAIIGPAYPYRGGLAAFNERLAKQLQDEGHNVHLYTFTLQYPSFLFPGKTQFSDGPAPKSLVITRMINSINPFNWKQSGKVISKFNPDVAIFAHWQSFMAPCMGSIARCLPKKTKQIALVHNFMPHEPSLADKILPFYFFNKMNGFLALSKAVLDDIRCYDKHNRPAIFAPHPIYDHYGEAVSKQLACTFLNVKEEEQIILFFGFIREYKGLDLLLNAFADIRLREFNTKLIVAGEFYENAQPYFELVKSLGIESDVIFRSEFIPDNQIPYYFSAADIVAQTYKTATQSGVTQIAYHFEKPMLVTNVGGLGEIVPHMKAGYAVAPNAKDIADALVDFFNNKRSQQMTEGVKQEKERFSWSALSNSLFSIINK